MLLKAMMAKTERTNIQDLCRTDGYREAMMVELKNAETRIKLLNRPPAI